MFVYDAFGIEKCPLWKGININMCLDENHFERFSFYTILRKKKLTEMSIWFKTF